MLRRPFRLVMLSVAWMGLVAGASRSAPPAPSIDKLGNKVELAVQDRGGQPARWTGAKATVVVFLSPDCPVSNSYAEPLTALAREYGPRGVAFVGFSTAGTPVD